MLALFVICLLPVVFAGSSCPRDFEYAVCRCTEPDRRTNIKCKESSTPEQISSDVKELSERAVIVDTFYIHSDHLNTIGPNYFSNITLIEAVFSTKNLTTVDKDAFKGQENSLERLEFSHTKLIVPPAPCIAGLNKLIEFAVFSNQLITTIDSQFYDSVPKNRLTTLDLSGNQITSFNLDVNKFFPHLQNLFIDNNKIEEEPKITLSQGNRVEEIALS